MLLAELMPVKVDRFARSRADLSRDCVPVRLVLKLDGYYLI